MGGDSTPPFRTGRRGHLKLVKKKGLFQASVKIVLGDSPFSVVQRRRGNWWKGHSIVPVFRFFLAKRVECKIGFNSFRSPYPAKLG